WTCVSTWNNNANNGRIHFAGTHSDPFLHNSSIHIKIRFTAETRRSLRRIFILIQSRLWRDDWIRNILPSGRKSDSFNGYGTSYDACIERTEVFLFGGLSPAFAEAASRRQAAK
ncbi:MAG: hypothetical protein LUQ65_01850, partial [Candidatus Helarchaeota archaeon]|nr:hypothetical protein [Candidatus Helarchaeota archaeon]